MESAKLIMILGTVYWIIGQLFLIYYEKIRMWRISVAIKSGLLPVLGTFPGDSGENEFFDAF